MTAQAYKTLDNGVMVLRPPHLPESTPPIHAPDADLCLSINQYQSDIKGQPVVVDPWLIMSENDGIRLMLNGQDVGSKIIGVGEENKRVTLWIPPLRLQANRINQITYTVTRVGQISVTSTPTLRLMYNAIRPGDKDLDPISEGHSELLLHLPPDVLENGIDAERAEQGVLVCVFYPYCRPYDTIWLDCNGVDVTHPVSEDEASSGQPVCFMVFKETFEQAGDNAQFIFKYSVIDQCGNGPDPQAPYSAPISVVVDLKGIRLDAPRVLEADPVTNVVDLNDLGDRDLTVQVNTPSASFKENDIIAMTWHGISADEKPVVEGPVELSVIQVELPLNFFIPNAKVKAIVNGRASVSYVLKRTGVADRPSKKYSHSVEGAISRLLQIVGSRSQTGPHYHSNVNLLNAFLSATGDVVWTYAGDTNGLSSRFFLDTEPERALIVTLQHQGDELDRMVLRPSNVTGVYSLDNRHSGCVTKDDGSVFGWSANAQMLPPPGLLEVRYVAGGGLAYAAIKDDATVKAWGAPEFGGAIPTDTEAQLRNVKKLAANGGAFVALRTDGSLVAWGSPAFGGAIPPAIGSQLINVIQIIGSTSDFSALLRDGRVFSWGETWPDGLHISAAQGAVRLCASNRAFAALKGDGSVVAWGSSEHGGSIPAQLLPQLVNVAAIASSSAAFAALKEDGTVIAWGNSRFGGSAPSLLQDVQHVEGSTTAFCALKYDGSLVAWGEPGEGGQVPDGLGRVLSLSASYGSFCAVLEDRTAVSWGINAGVSSLSPAACVYAAGPHLVLLTSRASVEAWGPGAPDLETLNGDISYLE